MKKILILSTILISFLLFSGCDNPSASTAKNDDSSSTEQQKETIDDTHQKDNEKDDEKNNNENDSNEQNEHHIEKRQGAYIIIPTPEGATVGEEKIISYSSVANNYSTDEYEIIIVENPDNIDVSIEASSKKIIVNCNSSGTIIFKVYNKTADCTSNECELTFEEEIEEPGITELTFVGTWTTNNGGLFDTIEFYSDGTGKCYHSKYPGSGSNTFKWVIRDTSTLKIWNSLNMESLCTYNFNGNELTLINFLGTPKDNPVLLTKAL